MKEALAALRKSAAEKDDEISGLRERYVAAESRAVAVRTVAFAALLVLLSLLSLL